MVDIQQTFQLNDIIVNPHTDQLSAHGVTIDVPSMAIKLLCYFAQNTGQLLTRDQLRDNIWKNTSASNHTINNLIYSLRQSLAKLDQQTKYIHTVTGSSGNGYRLVATVSNYLITTVTSQPTLPQTPLVNPEYTGKALYWKTEKFKNKIIPFFSMLSVLTVLIAMFVFYYTLPNTYQRTKTLTQQIGREQSPAISDDGEFIIYANWPTKEATWELYARKLSDLSSVTKIFNSGDNNDHNVSISPNKKMIAFSREKKDGKGIYLADFNSSTLQADDARLVISLAQVNTTTSISWLDNQQFYYTAKEASWAPQRIYLFNLIKNSSEQISSPSLKTAGDFSIVLSPNKKTLAIMRSNSINGHKVYLYDISNKEFYPTNITSDELRLKVSFSDDSKQLFFVDEQGFLSSYDMEAQLIDRISEQAFTGFWPLKVPNKEQFIMQTDWGTATQASQIVKYSNPLFRDDNSAQIMVQSDLSIQAIEGIANEELIFAAVAADRQTQLWRFKQGKSYKLNEFNDKPQYSYPLSLSWLKGSNNALLSVDGTCRLINIDTGKDSPLCPEHESLYAGSYTTDGKSILLGVYKNGLPVAVKMGVTGFPFEELPALKNAAMIQESANNELYYRVDPDFDIYHYNQATEQAELIIARNFIAHGYSSNDFVLAKKGIYYIDRTDDMKHAIYFYNFASKLSQFVMISNDHYPSFVLSENEEYIYLIESVVNDSKLVMIE